MDALAGWFASTDVEPDVVDPPLPLQPAAIRSRAPANAVSDFLIVVIALFLSSSLETSLQAVRPVRDRCQAVRKVAARRPRPAEAAHRVRVRCPAGRKTAAPEPRPAEAVVHHGHARCLVVRMVAERETPLAELAHRDRGHDHVAAPRAEQPSLA